MVVYAIEFTVAVYKVADIGGVIALGVLVAFLFGEVPFFGEFAQRRSGYGSSDVDDFFKASALDFDIKFGVNGRTTFAVCADFVGDIEGDFESAAGFGK